MSQVKHTLNKFPFEGIVWRVIPSDGLNHLLVEVRDGELRKISLVLIDLNSKQQLWEKQLKSWWTGIIKITEDFILLHTYSDPKMPYTKGICLLNCKDGNIAWEYPDYSFVELQEDKILVQVNENGEEVYRLANLADGSLSEVSAKPVDTEITSEAGNFNIKHPVVYSEGEEYFEEVKEFLAEYGIAAERSIEYLEVLDKIVVSAYSSGAEVSHLLLVFSENGELVFRSELGKDIQGKGLDTFFVIKEDLIFVQDKKEIVILGLNF